MECQVHSSVDNFGNQLSTVGNVTADSRSFQGGNAHDQRLWGAVGDCELDRLERERELLALLSQVVYRLVCSPRVVLQIVALALELHGGPESCPLAPAHPSGAKRYPMS